MIENEEWGGRREHVRKTVFLTAKLSACGQSVTCEIVNISSGGARLNMSRQVAFDTGITLNIGPFGEFVGEVVWQNGMEVGVRFLGDSEQISEMVQGIAMYGG